MGLTAFKRYHELLIVAKYQPKNMGFSCQRGDIIEFANRVRLARSFRGLQLEGYTPETVAGYNAFLLIFLTHSALERYQEIIGLKGKPLSVLGPLLLPYQPEKIASAFVSADTERRLFQFLFDRLSPKLQSDLQMIYDQGDCNVACLSGAIRHSFAHGHLTAHANKIKPKKVHAECLKLSAFLIDFMDAEFTKTLDCFEQSLTPGS